VETWQLGVVCGLALVAFTAFMWGVGKRYYLKLRQDLSNKLEPVTRQLGLTWAPPKPFILGMPTPAAALKGIVNGVDLTIAYDVVSGKGGVKRFTTYSAKFTKPVPEGLEIMRESIWNLDLGDLANKLSGGRDIQSGDPLFDGKVFVKGSSTMALQRLLSSPEARKAILELVDTLGCYIHWTKGTALADNELHEDSELVLARVAAIVSAMSFIQGDGAGQ
jgi:hypothetical protein